MIEKMLFNQTMSLMEKGLDTASLRNSVFANNLANVDTPDFKRSDVVFEDELRKAIAGKQKIEGWVTNEKHIPIGGRSAADVSPKVVLRNDTSMRNDGNNVDIDREMSALAKNTIMFTTVTQLLNGELSKLKSAIFEGRR